MSQHAALNRMKAINHLSPQNSLSKEIRYNLADDEVQEARDKEGQYD